MSPQGTHGLGHAEGRQPSGARQGRESNTRPKAKPAKVEMRFWTTEQARAFLATTGDDRLAALWQLALGAGLRRGELLGLRWEDVDLEVGTLHVRRARVAGRLLGRGGGAEDIELGAHRADPW
jgi:integrase